MAREIALPWPPIAPHSLGKVLDPSTEPSRRSPKDSGPWPSPTEPCHCPAVPHGAARTGPKLGLSPPQPNLAVVGGAGRSSADRTKARALAAQPNLAVGGAGPGWMRPKLGLSPPNRTLPRRCRPEQRGDSTESWLWPAQPNILPLSAVLTGAARTGPNFRALAAEPNFAGIHCVCGGGADFRGDDRLVLLHDCLPINRSRHAIRHR